MGDIKCLIKQGDLLFALKGLLESMKVKLGAISLWTNDTGPVGKAASEKRCRECSSNSAALDLSTFTN